VETSNHHFLNDGREKDEDNSSATSRLTVNSSSLVYKDDNVRVSFSEKLRFQKDIISFQLNKTTLPQDASF